MTASLRRCRRTFTEQMARSAHSIRVHSDVRLVEWRESARGRRRVARRAAVNGVASSHAERVGGVRPPMPSGGGGGGVGRQGRRAISFSALSRPMNESTGKTKGSLRRPYFYLAECITVRRRYY